MTAHGTRMELRMTDAELKFAVDAFCEDVPEVLAFVGTCQACGAYWDVRQRPVCLCGGEAL